MIPAYRRVGAGPPLVCHPGGPCFSARYLADLAGLGESFELILVDPRGTGATPPPRDGSYRLGDYMEDVEELRQALGFETIDLLGHSHGGVVAQAYAAAYPERVRKLVLASTLARFGPEQMAAIEAGIAAREGEPWYADAKQAFDDEAAGNYSTPEELGRIVFRELSFYFAHYGEREAAYLDSLRDEVLNVAALKYFNSVEAPTIDLRPDNYRITAETLVITGAEDFITGPVCAADLSPIAGAETVIVAGAGHIIFLEQPELFRAAVEAFLHS